MDTIEPIDRNEILGNAIEESELSDLKQHADKMIREFEKFNKFSSNRAVWELIQNACDLTLECEVCIDYSNGFSFTHNGKPFTTKSLISLIKQVSGKYGEESDIPEVGKYGTGFLSTHSFGRNFKINSLLEAKGVFFKIDDFLIDRSPKEWKELAQKIKAQKNNVYNLIKEGSIISNIDNKTTFTYIPVTEQEHNYIIESSKDLRDYIPIVLTINERLKKVTVINQTHNLIIERKGIKEKIENAQGINLFKTSIIINNDEKVIYSIIDEECQIEVILPINESLETFEFSDRIARLFLYYPLIGSEEFGVNFIINCKQFAPIETRNGIHLKSNKDQVKDQEESNRKIIEKATELIFDFLKSNVLSVSNPLLYAQINFKRDSDNEILNNYFEGLQSSWTENFKSLPIVETISGYKSVNESCFLSKEILDYSECFDDIYLITSLFYNNIPVKSKIVLWSEYVLDWNNESVVFISHKDLVLAISQKQLADLNKESLINYYSVFNVV